MSVSGLTYVHDGDRLLAGRTQVLDHVLDEHRALGHLALCDGVSGVVGRGTGAARDNIPHSISTLSELTSFTFWSPSAADMVAVVCVVE